jgi:hypothetical protein
MDYSRFCILNPKKDESQADDKDNYKVNLAHWLKPHSYG